MRETKSGALVFQGLSAPTEQELADVAKRTALRVQKVPLVVVDVSALGNELADPSERPTHEERLFSLNGPDCDQAICQLGVSFDRHEHDARIRERERSQRA